MGKDTGGAAFPSAGVVIDYDKNEHQQGAYEGMSLRDYFAAKAMQAALSCLQNPSVSDGIASRAFVLGKEIEQMIATDSYRMADAMLAERAK